jgi:hypothetical protein
MLDPPRKRTPGSDATPTRAVELAPPASSTTESVSHGGDPRRIGELLSDWLAIRMAEVDALVQEGESKVAAIPDQRHLWLLLGETLVRLHCLELEVAELRKGGRR